MKDHITHPQGRNSYIWRFYACQPHKTTLHTVAAHSELEARSLLPLGRMVFAARIRQGVSA